jgi:hypothetical protein
MYRIHANISISFVMVREGLSISNILAAIQPMTKDIIEIQENPLIKSLHVNSASRLYQLAHSTSLSSKNNFKSKQASKRTHTKGQRIELTIRVNQILSTTVVKMTSRLADGLLFLLHFFRPSLVPSNLTTSAFPFEFLDI